MIVLPIAFARLRVAICTDERDLRKACLSEHTLHFVIAFALGRGYAEPLNVGHVNKDAEGSIVCELSVRLLIKLDWNLP